MLQSNVPKGNQRGFSLIEALVATVIILMAFLVFGSGMITASQAENSAATHTQQIAVANYLLEEMRRDPNFWTPVSSPGGEWSGKGCTAGDCWTQISNNDKCGNPEPPYQDQSNATPHTGLCNSQFGTYTFLWRADPHGAGTPGVDPMVADLTVWVFTNVSGRQSTYKVTGLYRGI